MAQGYVKIYRQVLDNSIWYLEPFTYGQAWIDLIILANHKDNEINVRGNIIKIPRGTVGMSQENLAKRWKWSRGKVNRFLNFLEKKSENIIQQKSFTISLIHLRNYNRFQSGDTADSTADGQQTDINNNVKNEKNDNKRNNNSKELLKEKKENINSWFFENYWNRKQDILIKLHEKQILIDEKELDLFFLYWTEPSKTGVERWKLQKTFEVLRRIITWLQPKNFKPKITTNQTAL